MGSQNYALLSRDYLNLNARVDFHFAMVDSVCGPNLSENYIRFRFKGGGTSAVQRNRRAEFISMILQAYGILYGHPRRPGHRFHLGTAPWKPSIRAW